MLLRALRVVVYKIESYENRLSNKVRRLENLFSPIILLLVR